MIIENLRYRVLSRKEDGPETLPEVGDFVILNITPDEEITEETSVLEVSQASILAEYVAKLGPDYGNVRGMGSIGGGEALKCDAKYDVVNIHPLGSRIGQIIFKKVISDEAS